MSKDDLQAIHDIKVEMQQLLEKEFGQHSDICFIVSRGFKELAPYFGSILKVGDKVIGNPELLDQIQSMQETLDNQLIVLKELHVETYRLSEAYESHPEEEFNTYEVGNLYEKVHKAMGEGNG